MGQSDRALHLYAQYRERLADALGVDPSPMTQATHLRVLRGEIETLG